MEEKLYKCRSFDLSNIKTMTIINVIAAYLFIPTLSLKIFEPDFFQKISHSPELHCSRPCQRVPNFVKLSSVLSQYGVPQNIVNSIEAKEATSYGEVDIGKCIGSCQAQILTVIINHPLQLYHFKSL